MKKKSNQNGILTFDFIFSFLIVIGLFNLFYVFAYTLAATHATQYVMFSTARAFFAGDIDVNAQTNNARLKFQELTSEKILSVFYKNNIKLTEPEIGPISEYDQYIEDLSRRRYIGARVQQTAKILDVTIPFLGSTADQLEGNGFVADVGAYLYSEPTANHCREFFAGRAEAIMKLENNKYAKAKNYNGFQDILSEDDNGC